MKFETLITIKGRDKRKKPAKKWPVDPSERSKLLARRRRPHKVLRIFDLGQYADGTDVDYIYFVQPFPENFFAFMPDTATFSLNADWNDDLFAVDYETWPDVFKNISETAETDYNISILGEFEYRSSVGGLVPMESGARPEVAVSSGEYFPVWELAELKYTREPDFSSAGVSFTYDSDCDLFLAPMLHDRVGGSIEALGANHYTANAIPLFKSPLPRSATLNNATWAGVWAARLDSSLLDATETAFYRNLLITDRNPTMYRMVNYTPSFPALPHTYGTAPATSLPTAASAPDWSVLPNLTFRPAARRNGHCIGAIRKRVLGEDEWYFLWVSGTWSIADGDLIGVTV